MTLKQGSGRTTWLNETLSSANESVRAMLAFVFPGQGSQRPGMGAPWVDHPSWELVESASRVCERDVATLLLTTESAELTETHNAQLATFVLSMVILDAIERIGLEPALAAGHSLGEYSALVASGAISFDDGCRLVAARGEAMRQAALDTPGTMAAVLGLSDEKVDIACRLADGDVWVANFNSNGQVVIAGDANAIARAGDFAKELGAKKVVLLPVGGAFHTPYMASARTSLRLAIKEVTFHALEIAVVANVDAQIHRNAQDWSAIMSAQLCAPVRWHQSVQTLVDNDATIFVECGAGSVLSGLVKRIATEATTTSVATPDDLEALLVTTTAARTQSTTAAQTRTEAAEQAIADVKPVIVGRYQPAGEPLFMTERLVVSSVAGIFTPTEAAFGHNGTTDISKQTNSELSIEVGRILGTVAGTEVRSPFAGTLMGMLAVAGERVSIGQPIAWLRTASS